MEPLPLTARQKEILEYLAAFTREAGYPPTVREICRATGLRSPRSASQHLQALQRKGYIQRARDKSRAIRFLHDPDAVQPAAADRVVALSLRGSVEAGPVAPGENAAASSYLVDRALFSAPGQFLMRVEGDCMANEHIVSGDFIVVSPDSSVGHGDVVVARVGAEVSVKRYETGLDGAFLVSETGPLRVDARGAQVRIIGKVVGLIRPRC
jgi:repressor LexA